MHKTNHIRGYSNSWSGLTSQLLYGMCLIDNIEFRVPSYLLENFKLRLLFFQQDSKIIPDVLYKMTASQTAKFCKDFMLLPQSVQLVTGSPCDVGQTAEDETWKRNQDFRGRRNRNRTKMNLGLSTQVISLSLHITMQIQNWIAHLAS